MQRQRRDKETTKRLQLKANNQAPSKAGSASRTPTPKDMLSVFVKDIGCLNSPLQTQWFIRHAKII